MQEKKQFLILDCTIRDGGYINKWDFPIEFVEHMYHASSEAGINVFEIGFLSNDSSLPLWRRCPADAVKRVRQHGTAKIAAMLESNTVGMPLPPPSESGIDILRVALNRNAISSALPKIKQYVAQGYSVFFQLMGITGYRDIDILHTIEEIEQSQCVEYINIGDSYGSLYPNRTSHIISLMKANTSCKVGLHPHNNLQLGMANIIAAIDAGADIVDGSMYGMGRGGGNVPLELILAFYSRQFPSRFNNLPVLEFIDRYMLPLSKEFDWGYSLPSMLSGAYECHPYYTSRLVDMREYTIEQIMRTVQIVNQTNVIGFDDSLLVSIIESGFARNDKELMRNCSNYVDANAGCVPYANRHKGRPFLVLGNGPSLLTHKATIDSYIHDFQPIILGANNLDDLWHPHYHAFSNQRRFEQYNHRIAPESKVLLTNSINRKNFSRSFEIIRCFGSSATPLAIHNDVITTTCRSVSVLLAAVALVMGASSIAYAGLDGYLNINQPLFYPEQESSDDDTKRKKHYENESQLIKLSEIAKKRHCNSICFLTPTSYNQDRISY